MYLNKKIQLLEILYSIYQMIEVLEDLSFKESAIKDCIDALDAVFNCLSEEKNIDNSIICEYKSIKKGFNFLLSNQEGINEENILNLVSSINLIQEYIKSSIVPKLKIAFMPYKISMWDSLASIYEAAIQDFECEVQVIPIPYYQIDGNNNYLKYEGNQFPKEVSILHYEKYNLEVEKPDIIFIHNIYDQYNTIIRVPEIYYTDNLKKYTGMLVYVPYHISSPINYSGTEAGYAYSLPSIKNVDKVVLSGKFVEEGAIQYGISKEKILTLGSPKLDGLLNSIIKGQKINPEWMNIVENKKVILFNTSCMEFVNDSIGACVLLELVMDMVRYNDNLALIWRPHPLTRVAIERYTPNILSKFDMYYKGLKSTGSQYSMILDDTPNYYDAINISDILISGVSSILDSYMLTEKPVLFLGDKLPNNSLLPSDIFYYFYDVRLPWYKFISRFSEGYDPLMDNRKGLAARFYENVDGTCGEKVYQAIKRSVLEKFKESV